MISWLRRRQQGVSGAIFAGLLGSGLLLVTMGLVVDGGAQYVNRQSEQQVAQNALTQLMNDCVANTATCATASTASHYVNGVLPAGSTLVEVCGTGLAMASGGTSCAVDTGKKSDCQTPSGIYASSYVRVRTKSTDATGSHIVNDVSNKADAAAPYGCAQTALLAPNGARLNVDLPIALPACFATDSATERVLVSIDPSAEGSLAHGGPSCTVQTANGPVTERSISGFTQTSLLSPEIAKYCTGNTQESIPVGITVQREPNEKTDLCGNAMSLAKSSSLIGKTLYFPVVGPPSQTGQGNYEFTVRSFRAFMVTGFKLKIGSAGGKTSAFWTDNGCSGNSFCLSGYFTGGQSDVLFPIDPTTTASIPNLGLLTAVPLY